MNRKSVVIIGAGPAGMAAALTMQKAGQECIVIDENRFPREKACGGLLTMKSILLLSILLDDMPCIYSNSKMLKKVYVYSYDKKERLFSYGCNIPFYVITRLFLDNALVSQYKEQNGSIIENCKCKSVNRENKTIVTSQGDFRYDELIVANGADKIIQGTPEQLLQSTSKNPEFAYCGVTGISKFSKCETDGVHISVGHIREGYSWIFPQRDGSFNTGFAGKFFSGTNTLQTLYRDMLDTHCIELEKTHGGVIPISQKPLLFHGENIYKIGSSNGMIDALTGEGIFFALLSGIHTGLLLANKITYAEYQQRFKQISFLVRGGRFSADMLWKYRLLTPLLMLGSYLKKLDIHMTDYLISNYNYTHYSALLTPAIAYLNLKVPREKLVQQIFM